MNRSDDEKFATVLSKNTFYFFDAEFEKTYEIQNLNAICNLLRLVQSKVDQDGIRKEFFEELLTKPMGLRAMLALTGFSNESLKRLTTFLRIADDEELGQLTCRNQWCDEISAENLTEWSDGKIENLILSNRFFRKGLVNLFFEGSSNPLLTRVLPPFEIRKLSIDKLSFRPEAMIDTLVRYKEKGSYSGKAEKNPEMLIERNLHHWGIPFTSGDLSSLVGVESNSKRTMDFIIPDQEYPKIVIESSFLVTTSSGQGDKAKTEIAMRTLLNKYYPSTKFIGFIDGIGWYIRKGDLKRMVSAYDDVFTFHEDEIGRFASTIKEILAL